MMAPFTIEPLLQRDWGRVRAIYKEGLATGLAAFTAKPPTWTLWNAGHLPIGRLVARADGTVIGWSALARVADT
jgi:L-amino acid N-acyltransferase YncA